MERGNRQTWELGRRLVGAGLLASLLMLMGCTRGFYRKQTDKEVHAILAEKDRFAKWKIEHYHVYPDPRSRFADAGKPDHPPMPPDDPAVRLLSPAPQRPGKAGVAWVEGKGYLNLMAFWDSQNRAERALDSTTTAFTDIKPSEIRQAAYVRQDEKTPKLLDRKDVSPTDLLTKDDAKLCLVPPFLLKLDQAVELGLINSREFQTRREDLYLAALPVTVERFSFNTQFFALEEVIRQRSGRESVSGYGNFWQANSTLGFSKLFSTGALLLASFANQTVVNLTGPGPHTLSTSQVNLDIVQPLLRGGGRAVTLEPLTQVERNLLYEVRDYARFRKEFFQYITGGGDLSSLGDSGGVRGVSPTTGLSLGTGNPARVSVQPGGAAQLDLGVSLLASSEGFLPTLLRAAILRNEQKNVAKIREIITKFQGIKGGGLISDLQVDQVRLQLLASESTVLQREQELNDSLDRFKLQLGIPVTVPIELDDLPARPVGRQLVAFEEIIDQTQAIISLVADYDKKEDAPNIRQKLRKLLREHPLTSKAETFQATYQSKQADWEKLPLEGLLKQSREKKTELLTLLEEKSLLEEKGDVLPEKIRLRYEGARLDVSLIDLEVSLRRYERQLWKGLKDEAGFLEHSAAFRGVRNAFNAVVDSAIAERVAGVQQAWPNLPPLVVDGVNILDDPLERAYDAVARVALANRLDLMNGRAQLVDSWRQLTIFANSLMGVLNVGYHVDSITPPGEAKPLAFSGSRTRHQLFFNATLPLVRIAERNAYRASLIAYERARRNLMALEDSIVNEVRQEIRQLRVLAKTYEIQQRSVALAYTQREFSLEEFSAPTDPSRKDVASGSGAALTQQLLNALRNLPASQNQLYTIWINYHIVRQQLFLDLELMPLDYRGVWIDEYSYRQPVPHEPVPLPEHERGGALDVERHRARLLPPS